MENSFTYSRALAVRCVFCDHCLDLAEEGNMGVNLLPGFARPVIQAPMAGVQDGALTLAVSRAGGLGSLPCAMLSAEQLATDVAALAESGYPYNLNFFCHQVPEAPPGVDSAWRTRLAPYYHELEVHGGAPVAAAGRTPFDEQSLLVVEKFRPPFVSFHFGLPRPEWVARIKQSGARILSSATSVPEAMWLAAHGADIIIAQGVEAGGHRGMFLETDPLRQTGTFALVPAICAVVALPVVAAGGIGGPEGVAAAMRLGAVGVQVGTAFLLADEAKTSRLHRQALKATPPGNTVLTNVFSGRPARSIVNRLVREVGPMAAEAPPFPLAGVAVQPLRQAAEKLGSSDFSPLWSGQNAAGCMETSAANILERLVQHINDQGQRL